MQQSESKKQPALSVSPRRKAGVIAQQVLEEMVLYDGNTEMGYSLNASARFIWDLCDGNRTLATICEEISKDLDIEPEMLHDDVQIAVGELASLGLLRIEEVADQLESNVSA